MFKFLKDFLFEENEVAVAAPPATGSITSLDERLDMGAGTEQPAGSDGPSDKPFWNDPLSPAEPAAVTEPEATKASPLVLDIQAKGDDTTDEPLGGSPIDLDTLNEPAVVDPPAAPEPAKEEPKEEVKEEAPPVMDLSSHNTPPAMPEPAPEPEHTPEPEPKAAVPDVKIVDKEEADLAKIDDLMKKTQAEIAAEEKAIAQYEAEMKALQEKLDTRRARMTSLQQNPAELEKAKADLEILLRNKREVESKIGNISSTLSNMGGATDKSPSDTA